MLFRRPWKSLQLEGDFPLLFLQAQIDDARCQIQLTDLNRLWAVGWTRDEVLQSARGQGTSIDPSEDNEQFNQFVSKVGSALAGECRTTVNLAPGSATDGLDLTVSAPLPGSLPTFRWTIPLLRLETGSGSALEADIVTPLLIHANNLRSRIKHLVDELVHKDRVIAKVADKLDNIGQDLTQVFPGAAKSGYNKKIAREQLAKHVDGLAPFDATAWEADSTKATDEEDPSVDAIDALLAELPGAGLLSAHQDTVGIWWLPRGENIVKNEASKTSVLSTPSRRRASRRTASPPALSVQESSMAGNGFQRQTTPPVANINEDDETEDDDDLDVSSQRSSQPKIQASTSAPPRDSHGDEDSSHVPGLSSAMNGDKIARQSDRVSSPGGQRLGAFGGARESKTATPDPEPQADEPNNPPPTRSANGGRKLGGFGGRAKRKTPEPDPLAVSSDRVPKHSSGVNDFGGAEPTASQAMPKVSPAKAKTRLGAFGGRLQASSQPLEGNDTRHHIQSAAEAAHALGSEVDNRGGRLPEREEETEQEREDSEERANQRRDKLKAEIAERSKEPVKKKRRF